MWVAEINKDKKRYMKRFIEKSDAIIWYKDMAMKLFGKFCSLNKYELKN